ncbi:MAG: hypothetical protein WD649_01090 [Thermoleophilaceae bacterium]
MRIRLRQLALVLASAAVFAAGATGFAAVVPGGGAGTGDVEALEPEPRPQLPRGGRQIFPRYRVVAFAGAPQHDGLGALGVGRLDRAVGRLRRQARPYGRGRRRVLPALDLISVIALSSPGRGGKYRSRQRSTVIRRHLRAARRARALLILDIQPGRSTFPREVRALRRWLREPDVGIALDPEWNMGPRGVPGRRIGYVRGRTVNVVSGYLARFVRRHRLPQKLLIVHRFTRPMIRGRIKPRREVAISVNIDGFGTRAQKRGVYRRLARRRGRIRNGFKVFYKEDTGLMSPRQVMRLRPRPDVVIYE